MDCTEPSARAGCIERSRDLLGQELSALVGESYERAYQNMVRVQQLTELEETIDYSLALQLAQGDEAAAEGRRALIRDIWRERLHGVQRNHEVWQVCCFWGAACLLACQLSCC
jgi:FKBP12-rapamycin complex-associated protein